MYYKPLLLPLLIQVFLTFVVWIIMYYSRIAEMNAKQIDPQQLSTRKKKRSILTDSAASADNLENLFEMPVLFYTAILLALVMLWQDPALVALSWVFVSLRIVHSFIHITYNKVMHRFVVYFASSVALMGIWARLGWYIISF